MAAESLRKGLDYSYPSCDKETHMPKGGKMPYDQMVSKDHGKPMHEKMHGKPGKKGGRKYG